MSEHKDNITPIAPIDVQGTIVSSLHPHDILCGRGSGPNDHVGNINFRDLIAQRREHYLKTSSRAEKARIAIEILNEVRRKDPQGRFLERLHGKGKSNPIWIVVEEEKAMEKIKQALRQIRSRPSTSPPPSRLPGRGNRTTSPVISSSSGSQNHANYNLDPGRIPINNFASVPVSAPGLTAAPVSSVPVEVTPQQHFMDNPSYQVQNSPYLHRNENTGINSNVHTLTHRQKEFQNTFYEAPIPQVEISNIIEPQPFNSSTEISAVGDLTSSACEKLIKDLESSSIIMSSETYHDVPAPANTVESNNTNTNINDEIPKDEKGDNADFPSPRAKLYQRFNSYQSNRSYQSMMSMTDFLTSSIGDMSIADFGETASSTNYTSSGGYSKQMSDISMEKIDPRPIGEMMKDNRQDSLREIDLEKVIKSLDSDVS